MSRKEKRRPRKKVPRRERLKRFTPWFGGCFGGILRLIMLVLFILLLGSVGSMMIQDVDTNALVAGMRSRIGLLNLVPDILLSVLAFVRQSRRFYFIVTAGILFVFLIAAKYIRDIFDLSSIRQGIRFVSALLFAFPYPSLEIEDGEPKIPPSKENLLHKIGGPGFLIVQPGNVVILEGINGKPRICAGGVNFVEPFMKIRECISLDDQHGFVDGVVATTKDGVQIRVKDVHFRYRLRTGSTHSDIARQDQNNPFPFSYQAVLNMYYGRSIGAKGMTSWHNMVKFTVEGAITEYIRGNRFEDVSSPRADAMDPRAEIEKRFNSQRTADSLRRVGAELIWVDMGQFEIVDERIEEQLAEAWGAKWAGLTEVNRAYAEAKRQSNLVTGRAEAQAEMLISILGVFDEIEDWAEQEQAVRTIILASTAQILDGLADRKLLPDTRGEELPPPI